MGNPNMLFLDEPTNHLDLGAIDSLARALNEYKGGELLISHDFRLIDQVAKEIWVCENKKVTTWKADIRAYKAKLAKKILHENLCKAPAPRPRVLKVQRKPSPT